MALFPCLPKIAGKMLAKNGSQGRVVPLRFGLIERGVPHRGVPQKCVWGRASSASVRLGHVLRGLIYSTIETRHFDTYHVSDTYPCAPALRLEAVPDGYPPLRYPPYD